MAVNKEVYTANATWTPADAANLLRDAFIDAGLMTAWHDSFAGPGTEYRVLKIEHNNAKTYGSSFYRFTFAGAGIEISLSSGWKSSGTPPINVPTGTQFLDYHLFPADENPAPQGRTGIFSGSATSNLFLDRFTSSVDTKQSWFVFRQGANKSAPFSILHKDTILHSWLDLDKGIANGYSTIIAVTDSQMGYVWFRVRENIRRCLLTGAALSGITSFNGNGYFHNIEWNQASYFGVGSRANSGGNLNVAIGIALPIGKASANPAFATDYIPICTDLVWSAFTPTKLAIDFGIYMHYADNTTAYGDKFIVQSSVNEWEVLQFTNNSIVNDGASPTFLARVT